MKPTYNIYIDESSIDNPKNQFMIIGGLFLKRELRDEIKEKLKGIKKEGGLNIELKWTNLNKKISEPVKKIIDVFFEYIDKDFGFHCIVVDKRQVNYSMYHNDDKELAFYKFIFHLLKHKFSYNTDYYLFLDFKQTRVNERVQHLQKILDGHIYFNYKNTALKHVQAYDSQENIFLQVADLFIGAVGYCYNGYCHKAYEMPPTKKLIVEYIAQKIFKSDLLFHSLPSEKKFNVYKIDLKKRNLPSN